MPGLSSSSSATRLLLALLAILQPIAAQLTSNLWGAAGELWDPDNSRLGNFTDVGYMSGDVAIPNWPVGVDVTNYGAVPDDGLDDSQAFIDAIAACPDFHAVFVPVGRYTILQRIAPTRDHFVLRGEEMYQTILHFPKYLNEIYIQEVGYQNPEYDDGSNGARHTGSPKGFFRVSGGTQRSIENLSFEFREQRKMGHWEHKGASAIYYGGDVTDSWVRNIYIKNGDHSVMMGRSYRVSFLNIVLDHYIGRPDIIGSGTTHRWVGHIGMSMSNAQHCLFHNIDIRGNYFHEFDNVNVPKNCVVSNITGADVSLHHHGGGARFNLYTNASVGKGPGISGLGSTQEAETHWRIFGDTPLDPPTTQANLANNHVFVGYDSDQVETIDATTWFEEIDPAQLQPHNIYLAQLGHASINKPLPEPPPAAPPSPFTGDVIRINPIEDNSTDASNPDTVQDPAAKAFTVGDNMYFKFDLTGLSLSSIAKVRLRVASTKFLRVPFELAVSSIDDDSWSEGTLTFTSRPQAVELLDTIAIDEDSVAQVLEFHVTPFVQTQWTTDKVVSLVIKKVSGSGDLSGIRSSKMGIAPELIIEQVASAVPGPPSAPSDVRSFSLIGNIRLDWPDNPEADVASYQVYRSLLPSDFSQYEEPIASGLLTSDFVDVQHLHDTGWDIGMMRDDQVYYYRVTAVDSHGYESESSFEIVATAKGYADDNLGPSFVSNPVVLPDGTQYEEYSGSLVGSASDPEGDPLFFSKIDGPDWLKITHDGTLSGTPRLGDTGTFSFTVQVNSLGSGRDETTMQLTVNPAPPDAPLALDIVPGDTKVDIDWAHSSEISGDYDFNVYRSLTAGGPYTKIASDLSVTHYTDQSLANATTYYYVVTATNSSGESPHSDEVAGTPLPGLSIVTSFVSGLLSDPTAWDAGLPVGKWGRIHVDATADTSIALDGYSVLHTGGIVSQSGISRLSLINGTTWITDGPTAATSTSFRGFGVSSGSTFTLREGTIHTSTNRDWSVNGDESMITITGGTINLGRHLLLSSGGSLTIEGGFINGNPGSGDIGVRHFASNGSMNFNGGVTNINQLDLRGSNSTINFGGSSKGIVTASTFAGSFGSNSTINFLPGSEMSLTVSGEDEWAATKWTAGDLTFNGAGVVELGDWATVSAPDGLGPGTRFDYDSSTETLLVIGPDGDGDSIDDSWEVIHFGSKEVIDGSVDSDGDGVTDFFEYLYGSDPNAAASNGFRLRSSHASGAGPVVFQWTVREEFALGTHYQACISTNLGAWSPLPQEHYSLQTNAANGRISVELSLTAEYGSRVFLKLAKP